MQILQCLVLDTLVELRASKTHRHWSDIFSRIFLNYTNNNVLTFCLLLLLFFERKRLAEIDDIKQVSVSVCFRDVREFVIWLDVMHKVKI